MEHPLLGKSDRLTFNNFPSESIDLEDFKTPEQKLLYYEMLVLSEVMMIIMFWQVTRASYTLPPDWRHHPPQCEPHCGQSPALSVLRVLPTAGPGWWTRDGGRSPGRQTLVPDRLAVPPAGAGAGGQSDLPPGCQPPAGDDHTTVRQLSTQGYRGCQGWSKTGQF